MYGIYVAYVIALALSLCVGVFLLAYSWQRRHMPTARAFAGLTLATNLVILGNLFLVISPSPEWAFFWGKIRYTGFALIPVFYLMFVLEYVDHEQWIRLRRWWVGLLIIPLLTLAMVWIAEPWFYRQWSVERREFIYIETVTYNTGFLVYAFFSYSVIFYGLWLLLREAIRALPPYREQAVILALGGSLGVLTSLLTLARVFEDMPGLTPIGMTVRNIIFAWGLFSFKLLDILPIAYAAIFNSMKEGVIMIDQEERVVNMNPAALQLVNRTLPEVIGQPAAQVFSNSPELVQRYRHVMEARVELIFGTGANVRYFEMQISPLYRHTRQMAGRLVMMRDITERKQQDQEREQLIATLNAYAHMVAHDLKNPLSVMMGYADFLQEMSHPDPEVDKMLGQIIQTGQKANSIIDDLLLFASVRQMGHVPTDVLDPSISLHKAITRLETVMQEAAAQVNVTSPLPAVRAYGAWLEGVWVNLISNAVKYGGQPPMIEINAVPQGQMVRFQVRDNGAGLSAEELSRLFQKVARLERHTDIYGHGFGLTIIQMIITRLGGEVGVESTPGQGSTFYFTLPAS